MPESSANQDEQRRSGWFSERDACDRVRLA
jgi:hypothetical protein